MEQAPLKSQPESSPAALTNTLQVVDLMPDRETRAQTSAASRVFASALGWSTADHEALTPDPAGEPETAAAAGPSEDLGSDTDASVMEDLPPPPPDGYATFMRDQDRLLPASNVAKIMSRELRHVPHAKVSKDAKNFLQESATEWICFIMSEANDLTLAAHRKAVSGQDVIDACGRLDMHEWVAPLTHALPHLQPPKRQRNRRDGEAAEPARRRRRRVTDAEVEQMRLERLEVDFRPDDGIFHSTEEAPEEL